LAILISPESYAVDICNQKGKNIPQDSKIFSIPFCRSIIKTYDFIQLVRSHILIRHPAAPHAHSMVTLIIPIWSIIHIKPSLLTLLTHLRVPHRSLWLPHHIRVSSRVSMLGPIGISPAEHVWILLPVRLLGWGRKIRVLRWAVIRIHQHNAGVSGRRHTRVHLSRVLR
jgi:hypothetical protein